MAGLLGLVLGFFFVIALVSIFALHGHTRRVFCGCVTAIFSICMYASPLSIMKPRKADEKKDSTSRVEMGFSKPIIHQQSTNEEKI
ncbi:Bidirectional sugar transporter SWEET1a [Acorus gramineus]|uniref:Bidirectional sugar transporter SWEET1a n=1 Tax=Acorus gramineus TaxID=55184 RepID=A0AAV9BIN2_ACOGR|nr:Bidirectional sugar transporter SWEET1a [Acorus gramineus]